MIWEVENVRAGQRKKEKRIKSGGMTLHLMELIWSIFHIRYGGN